MYSISQSISNNPVDQEFYFIFYVFNYLRNNPLPLSHIISLSISRIFISLNPNLLPRTLSLPSFIPSVIELINSASHELYIFEALLALTNIASMATDDVAIENTLVQLNAWTVVKTSLSSNNTIVQRAGIECLTNLILCEHFAEHVLHNENELKLFILFTKSDDIASVIASTGAIAMLTNIPEIVLKLKELNYDSVLKQLIVKHRTNIDIMKRIDVIISNLK